jgi:CRISPR/Cas system-associated protein Cas10 (large subunit of type III CRISPR-Cas system)
LFTWGGGKKKKRIMTYYNFRIKNSDKFRKDIYRINYCVVCGDKIPLTDGGKVSHKGICRKVYQCAVRQNRDLTSKKI